jgi:hypothetical protein
MEKPQHDFKMILECEIYRIDLLTIKNVPNNATGFVKLCVP